jgi:hypothetical protein
MIIRMDPTKRYLLLPVAGMLLWLSCTPKETSVLLGPSEALGKVLAEETMRIAGTKKQVAIISPDIKWGAVSTAEEAFRNALKKQGVAVVATKAANLGDPMRRSQLGLKAGDFIDALEASAGTGAIVSFAGAPMLGPGDADRVQSGHPPVLVVATASLGNVPGVWGDPLQLARLLEAKAIDLAIIDSTDPTAPPSGRSDIARGLFAQHYSILRRPN